jgi:hypothetical protein
MRDIAAIRAGIMRRHSDVFADEAEILGTAPPKTVAIGVVSPSACPWCRGPVVRSEMKMQWECQVPTCGWYIAEPELYNR